MIKIKNLADLSKLEKNKEVYSNEFQEHLETYLRQLWQESVTEKSINEFSLEDNGYIIILEQDDNLEDLSQVGLNKEDKGLLGTIPEVLELKEFDDGSSFYQIGIIYNDEYMMTFYLAKELANQNISLGRWLSKNSESCEEETKGYKFNNPKYLTRGIEVSIPIEIQIFLWEVIAGLSNSKIMLDYLQIFNINKTANMITIIHEQEEPTAFKRHYKLMDPGLLKLDIKDKKIYVIDNNDYSIMLLAEEY